MEPHYDDTNVVKATTPKLTNLKDDDLINGSSSTTALICSDSNFEKGEQAVKRSNTSIDLQFRCAVNSDRLNQLKKTVETAIREHKTFTIKGKS